MRTSEQLANCGGGPILPISAECLHAAQGDDGYVVTAGGAAKRGDFVDHLLRQRARRQRGMLAQDLFQPTVSELIPVLDSRLGYAVGVDQHGVAAAQVYGRL